MTLAARQPRRRRPVVAATLVVGCALLGVSLATAPGDSAFYPLLLAVAVTWTAGAFASGPVPVRPPRDDDFASWLRPVVLGVLAAGVFVLGALAVREIDPLRDYAPDVLDHAQSGNGLLVLALTLANGVAEEFFFRGALWAAVGPRHPLLATTVIYAAVTAATANPLLVFAGVLMGGLFALQRQWSGGVRDPLLTHVTWSLLVLSILPVIID